MCPGVPTPASSSLYQRPPVTHTRAPQPAPVPQYPKPVPPQLSPPRPPKAPRTRRVPRPHPGVAAHIEPEERAGGRGEEAAEEPWGQEADAALGGVEPGIIREIPVGSRTGLEVAAAPARGRRHFPAAPTRRAGTATEEKRSEAERFRGATRGGNRDMGQRH